MLMKGYFILIFILVNLSIFEAVNQLAKPLHINKLTDFNSKLKESLKFFNSIPLGVKNGLASGLASIVAKVVLQPFDTIKTVQQSEMGGYVGPLTTAIKIVKNRGILGLYSGLGITVLGSAPSIALYFGCYSSIKSKLTKLLPDNYNFFAIAISASLSNTIASILRVPYEVIKQRLQAGLHKSSLDAILYIAKEEGIQSVFMGGKLASQMLRDVPYAVITLLMYETVQKYLSSKIASKKLKDSVCGSIAGGIGTFVTTPLDLIKTRMQIGGKYSTIPNAIQTIIREEGFGAFMIGMGPRLMHKIPANGVFFLFYEVFKNLLGVETADL